jgi:hypothetical protein
MQDAAQHQRMIHEAGDRQTARDTFLAADLNGDGLLHANELHALLQPHRDRAFAAQESEQAQDEFLASGGTEWNEPATEDPQTRAVVEALIASIDGNADAAITIHEVLEKHEDFLGATNVHAEL